ncbi:MAG: MFS transporter [Clostridium perfringens]|nr:MFS transporter [Clostridium perfringens]
MEAKKSNSKLVPILVALPSIGLGLAWNMNSTVVPLLVETATKSAFQLAILVAMASVTGIFAPYISGVLSDKLGRRKPFVLFASIAGAIFLFCLGFSSVYWEMFVFAFLFYFSMNFYQGSYYSWMPEAVQKHQIGLVNGWGKLFYSVGGIIVFGIGVSLFAVSPALPLIVAGVVVLISNFITVGAVKEDRSSIKKASAKLSLDFLKNASAMKVFMTAFFLYLAYGLIMPYWLPYFEKANGFSSSEISYALIGFTIVGLILSVFIGMLCDRYNKQIILFVTCVIYFIGFLVGMYVMNLGMLWGFTIIFGLGFAVFQVVFYALIPAVAPKDRLGEYMGINNVFLCIPQIIGNLLAGSLMTSDMGLIFPLALISIVVAGLICIIGKMKFVNN